MSDTKEDMLAECDDIVRQLKIELHAMIEAKWEKERGTFTSKKKLIVTLLKTLIQDVRSIKYK